MDVDTAQLVSYNSLIYVNKQLCVTSPKSKYLNKGSKPCFIAKIRFLSNLGNSFIVRILNYIHEKNDKKG